MVVSTPRSRSILAEVRWNHSLGSRSTSLVALPVSRALRRKLRSPLVWVTSGLDCSASSRAACSGLAVMSNWERQVSWAPSVVAKRWNSPGANRPVDATA